MVPVWVNVETLFYYIAFISCLDSPSLIANDDKVANASGADVGVRM